jgi:hypothetical protein
MKEMKLGWYIAYVTEWTPEESKLDFREGQEISSSLQLPNRLWSPHSLIINRYQWSLPGVKATRARS